MPSPMPKNEPLGVSYWRLERAVQPLVGLAQLAAAVLARAGDPAEPGVVALGPPRLRLGELELLRLAVDLLEERDVVRALAPDELLLALSALRGALASRNAVTSSRNSSSETSAMCHTPM